MKTNKANNYRLTVAWDEDYGAFIARCPAFPGLSADGETPEAAVAEARVVLERMVGILEDEQQPLPETDQTLEQVRAMLPLINISKLSRLAKINRQTLASKLERGTAFSREEARRIHHALDAVLT
ncbi:MAG: type II toxin-antitoxin system HicB family antitoxin [Opitutaceae bacterium]|jgi:predicted RNase H-like HicB family nuclease|nr:type II toxin-antitoxin system HicB family antitoxin [Opitutaceae bacterium]